MSNEDQIAYHSKRAMKELDLGLMARSIPAARAHMQLSSLHLQRARELSGKPGQPPLRM